MFDFTEEKGEIRIPTINQWFVKNNCELTDFDLEGTLMYFKNIDDDIYKNIINMSWEVE